MGRSNKPHLLILAPIQYPQAQLSGYRGVIGHSFGYLTFPASIWKSGSRLKTTYNGLPARGQFCSMCDQQHASKPGGDITAKPSSGSNMSRHRHRCLSGLSVRFLPLGKQIMTDGWIYLPPNLPSTEYPARTTPYIPHGWIWQSKPRLKRLTSLSQYASVCVS